MAKSKVDNKKVNRIIKRIVIIFYSCFVFYLLTTRKPNYFSSEKTTGIIVDVQKKQVMSEENIYVKEMPVIHFQTATDSVEFIYSDDEYLTKFHAGQLVKVVYQGEHAGNAAILALIGYWVTLNELMASLMICVLVIGLVKVFYSPRL